MARAWQAALADTIGAIGDPSFAARAAGALRRAGGFDLAAAIVHRDSESADLLFDDFGAAGHGDGIRNYVRFTHRMNPMLHPTPRLGAIRARDFAIERGHGRSMPHLVWSADEEMGFRTLGWPAGCEEIGLYFAALGGVVELSLYRPRARAVLPAAELEMLGSLAAPLAAAFDRNAAMAPALVPPAPLSARESEIHALLLAGCSSEAIALRLDISRHTVKDHRKQIFRKLGVGSLAELFAQSRRAN